MEFCTQENGLKQQVCDMAEVCKFGKMDHNTKVTGNKEKLTDEDDLYFIMEMFTKANFLIIVWKDLENI